MAGLANLKADCSLYNVRQAVFEDVKRIMVAVEGRDNLDMGNVPFEALKRAMRDGVATGAVGDLHRIAVAARRHNDKV